MSIARCPKPTVSWKKYIEFPLFKSWQKRLEENLALATVKEVRKQLNNMNTDWVLKRTLLKLCPMNFLN